MEGWERRDGSEESARRMEELDMVWQRPDKRGREPLAEVCCSRSPKLFARPTGGTKLFPWTPSPGGASRLWRPKGTRSSHVSVELLPPDYGLLLSIDSFLTVAVALLIFSTILRRPRLAIRKMTTLPKITGTDPSRCIFDSFRAAIARQVADALPSLTPEQAYAGVDYGKKGVDFTIAIPRFRLPGKPDDLGKKVIENVSVPA